MTISVVQAKSGSIAPGASVTVTLTSATTSGNTLIACIYGAATSITGVTLGGSAGNWASQKSLSTALTGTVAIWADPNCAGGQTSVVVTQASSALTLSVTILEVAGLATSSILDKSNSNGPASLTTSAWTSNASGTTTQASEIAIGVVGGYNDSGSATTITGPASPWTNETQVTPQTGVFLEAGYQILSATGSLTYSGTSNISGTNNAYIACVATFLAGSSGTTTSGSAGLGSLGATGTASEEFASTGTAGLGSLGASGSASFPIPITTTGTAGPGSLGGSGAALGGNTTTTGTAKLGILGASGTAAETFASTGTAGLGHLGATGSALGGNTTSTGTAGLGHLGAAGTGGETFASTGTAGLGLLGGTGTSAPPTLAVSVAGTNSYTIPNGYYFPFPSARPLQVAVSNTAGDWMFALVTWRQGQAGAGVTVSVADDAHNVWEPLGAPSGDSDAAGVTRTAIWYAPAARAAQIVQAAPTGLVISIAAEILDVAGLSKWYTLTGVTPGFANAATSLSLGIGTPATPAFMLAALGTDLNTATITGPGAGWTALPAVTATNGTDHTTDLKLSSAWQGASTAQTAAWSSTASLDLSGVTAGVLITSPSPAQPNINWPVVITEIAPGAGFATPPSQITWTALSARSLTMNATQGRQYTLGQLQAGTGTMVIDNPDGALIPPGTGAFAGIDSGTPVRMRVLWPPAATPHYVAFSGYFQRWPFNVDTDMLRGQSQATIQDVWAYAAGTLDSMGREEYLLDEPYAFWPLDDPAGATSGANLAPGNSSPLNLTPSKFGNGGGTGTFGNTDGALAGDSTAQITTSGRIGGASGLYTQVLATPPVSFYGYALNCTDPAYPPIASGVTIEAWAGVSPPGPFQGFVASTTGSVFNFASGTLPNGTPVYLTVASGDPFPGGFSTGTIYYVVNSTSSTLQLSATYNGTAITVTTGGEGFMTTTTPSLQAIWSARGVKGVVLEVDVSNLTGAMTMQYQTAAGATHTVTIDSSRDYRSGGHYQVVVAFTRTSYTVYLQGGSTVVLTGSFAAQLPAAFTEFSMGGVSDRGLQGNYMPGNLAFGAIFPALLTQTRIVSHFWGAGLGMVDENASNRIERILEYASLTGRRCILQEDVTYEGNQVVSGSDVGGQPAATSVNNVAASTVPAIMTVAPTGDMFYLAKLWIWNQPVRWVLGDDAAGGEVPFLPSFATDYDPSRVVDDIQLTQLDTSAITIPAGAWAAGTMAGLEAASRTQYGDQPYQQTGYLTNDATSTYTAGAGLQDLANWLASVYANPRNRVQSITVEASANEANTTPGTAWEFWAGAAAGDMVTVNVRLATAATVPLISLTARITQTTRTLQFSQGGTSATIACVLDFAPESQALTCDDPVLGLLNGSDLIGW